MKAKQSVGELIDYDADNVWHVTPINDSKEHEELLMCWCNPKIEIQVNKGLVVTHKSHDMREYQESEENAQHTKATRKS